MHYRVYTLFQLLHDLDDLSRIADMDIGERLEYLALSVHAFDPSLESGSVHADPLEHRECRFRTNESSFLPSAFQPAELTHVLLAPDGVHQETHGFAQIVETVGDA